MTIKTIADPFMNEEIEAVIICSSTNTHAQFIIEAAKAGKHIFCEKPIDYDLARVHEAISTAKLITPEGSRGAEMYSIMFDR